MQKLTCLSESFPHTRAQGEIKGRLVEPRGTTGFGFDSCFQPDGYEQTLAELGPDVKHRISHRYLALKALKAFFDCPSPAPKRAAPPPANH